MKYVEKLKKFQGANGDINSLDNQFEMLAKYFLCEGYFLVNEKRKIHICDVEFYYHEEKGNIKDWIMYHRNNHPDNKNEKKLGYLDIGQLNSHRSGIDITFENPNKEYRAGMLIRGFKVIEPECEPRLFDYSYSGMYDERSTHFYDALLNYGGIFENGFSIQWISEKGDDIEPKKTYRKNVAKYKDHKENEKEEYSGTGKYITIKKIKYKQCMRLWRFHIPKD